MTYQPFFTVFSFLKPAIIIGGLLPHERGTSHVSLQA